MTALKTVDIREEDIQDILALLYAIEDQKRQLGEAALEEQRMTACANWIEAGLKYAHEQPLIPFPQKEIASHHTTIAHYLEHALAAAEKARAFRIYVEHLQEALTFFLAERYAIDAVREQWTISLENKCLECIDIRQGSLP